MNDNVERWWCAVIQYPNLKPLIYGQISVSIHETDTVIEQQMMNDILECLPPGFQIIKMIPGYLTFHEKF
jgi:hypothetical protein